MTTEGDDLVARVVRLERDVRAAREDAAAALVLARGADHDVATMSGQLNGHIRVLTALRETQLEHGEMLRSHGERLNTIETRLDRVERKVDDGFRRVDENFQRIEEKFAVVGAGLEHITALLTGDGDGEDRT